MSLNPARALLNLVYPDLCIICKEESRIDGNLFCIRCLSKLPFRDIQGGKQELFVEHFSDALDPEFGLALFHINPQSPVAKLIHQLKYHDRPHLGVGLGSFMGDCLKDIEQVLNFDVIVPVPLHKKKEKQRGYNQSERIAVGLANRLAIKVDVTLLQRQRFTVTQTRLNKEERQKNMADAFKVICGQQPTYRHVLLIDDVLTTGATLKACAIALQKAGYSRLSMMTLALGD